MSALAAAFGLAFVLVITGTALLTSVVIAVAVGIALVILEGDGTERRRR